MIVILDDPINRPDDSGVLESHYFINHITRRTINYGKGRTYRKLHTRVEAF